jgi:hypothetical protein
MRKILISIISLLLFNSCISLYKNENGNERPKNPRFKLSKIINKDNTGLEGLYREQNQGGYYFRFFKNGRVFLSGYKDFNQLNTGYIGYYTLQESELKIEILYATQGYSYWLLKGTLIHDKIKFYKVSKKNPKHFDGSYSRIDVKLQTLEPDW